MRIRGSGVEMEIMEIIGFGNWLLLQFSLKKILNFLEITRVCLNLTTFPENSCNKQLLIFPSF